MTLTLTMCCVAFSVLILGLAIALNKAPNKANTSAQYIYGNNSIVKLEVTDDITLEDDTIEKLQPKIKVTSTGKQGKFGALVTVTPQNVIFDYTLDNTKHSFATMGKDITIDNGNDIGGGSTFQKITNETAFASFRRKVEDGKTYSGVIVILEPLNTDTNFSWGGTVAEYSDFSGTFDGCGNTVTLNNPGDTSKTLVNALFGNLNNGKIINLNVANSTFRSYAADTQKGYNGAVFCINANNSTIENCNIEDTVTLIATEGGAHGSFVGSGSNVTIKNCASKANITAGTADGIPLSIGGIAGCATGIIENCLFDGGINLPSNMNGSGFEIVQVAGILGDTYTDSSITIKGCVVNISNIKFNAKYTESETKKMICNFAELLPSVGSRDETVITNNAIKAVYPIYAGIRVPIKFRMIMGLGYDNFMLHKMGTDLLCTTEANYTVYSASTNIVFTQKTCSVVFSLENNYYFGSSSSMNSDWQNYAGKKLPN